MGYVREYEQMKRRMAAWLVLLGLASSGAYGVPSARVFHGVQVEICAVEQDSRECAEELRTGREFTAAEFEPANSPETYPCAAHTAALYQRPPPAAF
jgi:hypothetical protein